MIAPRRRGYTLPELMIAGALFIGLAAMAAFGMKMGMDATATSNDLRMADMVRGDVLNRLTDEMRTAAPLPVLGLGSSQVPSGVIYPDQYGNGSPFGGTFYTHAVTAANTYQVKNRVILTRPKREAGGTFAPANLDDYVYVDWFVPDTARHQIWRRVHAVKPPGPPPQGGHQLATGKWLAVHTYFTNGTNVSGSTSSDWLVAQLPKTSDTFELTVETPRYIDPNTNSPATEDGFNTLYDRHLFKIYLKTTTTARGNLNKKTERIQESMVRVQAGQ